MSSIWSKSVHILCVFQTIFLKVCDIEFSSHVIQRLTILPNGKVWALKLAHAVSLNLNIYIFLPQVVCRRAHIFICPVCMRSGVQHVLTLWVKWGWGSSYNRQELLIIRERLCSHPVFSGGPCCSSFSAWIHTQFLVGVRVVHLLAPGFTPSF